MCYLECAQDKFLKQGSCDFSLEDKVPESFADYSKLEEFFKQYQSNFWELIISRFRLFNFSVFYLN